MLQVSQIEKPICSATIDQIKLRRAMNLPLASQNFVSSGFQSEIQEVLGSLILRCPSFECSPRLPRRIPGQKKAAVGKSARRSLQTAALLSVRHWTLRRHHYVTTPSRPSRGKLRASLRGPSIGKRNQPDDRFYGSAGKVLTAIN